MKIKTTVAALSVLSFLSFGAFAADSIDAAQAQNREAIGTVSVSGVASSPMDMREMLNKKAEEKGATAYQITEARSGDTWHATAELYQSTLIVLSDDIAPGSGAFFCANDEH